MIRWFLFLTLLAVSVLPGGAVAAQQPQAAAVDSNPSGTYSFVREGEFVQLTFEDGKLSGYVSRYGDSDTDKGEFIDQFFDKASLKDTHLAFTTKTVHGVWYEFTGEITTAADKHPGQDGYRVIKGTLVQHAKAADKDNVSQREVEFRSFPQDLGQP